MNSLKTICTCFYRVSPNTSIGDMVFYTKFPIKTSGMTSLGVVTIF